MDGRKETVFIKIAPCIYLLNPIGLAWSQVKATIKKELKDKVVELENPPTERNQRKHQLKVMENIIDNAMAPPPCLDSFYATGYISHL